MQKPQGGEVPLIPNLNNPLMELQPTPLQSKAPATASAVILPARDETPWPTLFQPQQIYLLPGHGQFS